MNYETLSNAELNQTLTGIIFKLDQWELTESGRHFFMQDAKGEQHVQSVVNYCADWNATMPLAVENELSIDPRSSMPKLGYIISRDDKIYAVDKSPLRAIVICLIKVMESK